MPTAVEIIARRLAEAGIRDAWGIPGGEVLALVDALRESSIRFNLVKHENAGGFMAEGCHHATGAPALLVATLGPGVANAVNFIANAQQDRVPVLFLTGCVDAREAVSYTHQVFDHQAVLSPICKASFRLADGAVDEIIDKALAIAMEAPRGPVHIDIPIGLATSQQPVRRVPVRCEPRYGQLSPDQIETVSSAISNSRRVLAVAGLGVLEQGAEQALSDFLQARQIPLITTYKAKGILPEDNPLSLGASGLSPLSESLLLPLVQQAEVILLFGYDPIEMRPGWRNPWSSQCRVFEFGTLMNTHYMHQSEQQFYVDLNLLLPQLQAATCLQENWPGKEIHAARKSIASAFSGSENWGPHAIIQTAQHTLPAETVATVDTGAHRILLSQIWTCRRPRSLLQSSGLCTMGVAVPMALGYKLSAPGHPVVAFTGDAGLEMVLGDLATLRDLQVPIIIVVFVDESLALIELKQRGMGYPNTGVDFAKTDFVSIGRCYGFHSAWIDDADTLATELRDALARSGTTLLACRFSRKAYDGAF